MSSVANLKFSQMHKIKIAIVGVGNCASSLLQGINFYRNSSGNGADVGLMHRQIGPYQPQDIEVVAAFDIDRRKVGLDVPRRFLPLPNCTKVFYEKNQADGRDRDDGLRFRWLCRAHAGVRCGAHLSALGKGIVPRTNH